MIEQALPIAQPSPISVSCLAQTNLQLYQQMRAAGYDRDDLWRVAGAYELAVQLFAARFRAYGKPFVDHLVGTAAVLAHLRVPVALVIAGLLHASYEQGDFGFVFRGNTKASSRKRRYLRQRAGTTVDDYVYRYTNLLWNEANIADLQRDIACLDGVQRDVILIRLANELDDQRDLAMLHITDPRKRLALIRSSGKVIVAIARQLGQRQLGDELARVFAECLAANPVDFPCRPPSRSYIVLPASYRRSLPLVTHTALRSLRRKFFRLH